MQPFTSTNLPKLKNLVPVSRLSGTYQLVLVVESPPDLRQQVLGTLTLTAFDTVPGIPFSGGPLLVSPSGVKLDFARLYAGTDSVRHAAFDSSLLAATSIVNPRRNTMTIGLGELRQPGLRIQIPLAVLFVTDVSNGITGLWVGQGENDASEPRGFFCATMP
jgi:hypothetical protein